MESRHMSDKTDEIPSSPIPAEHLLRLLTLVRKHPDLIERPIPDDIPFCTGKYELTLFGFVLQFYIVNNSGIWQYYISRPGFWQFGTFDDQYPISFYVGPTTVEALRHDLAVLSLCATTDHSAGRT
jgi:hypothetical protein